MVRATLQVYAEGWAAQPDLSIGAYYITRTVDLCQATWNQARSGGAWASPGANNTDTDRRPSAESSVTANGIGKWYEFDLSAVTQGWVSGSLANNGVLLRADYATAKYYFSSRESGSPAAEIGDHLPYCASEHCHSYGNTHRDTHTDLNTKRDSYPDPNPYTHPDADQHAHSYCLAAGDGYCLAAGDDNGNSDSDRNANGALRTDGYGDADRHAHRYADEHPDRDQHADAAARVRGCAAPRGQGLNRGDRMAYANGYPDSATRPHRHQHPARPSTGTDQPGRSLTSRLETV